MCDLCTAKPVYVAVAAFAGAGMFGYCFNLLRQKLSRWNSALRLRLWSFLRPR